MAILKKAAADRQFRVDLGVSLSLALIAVFFIASGTLSYLNIRTLNRTATLVSETHEILLGLEKTMSLLKDAETGQRGFILTGDRAYLTA